MLTRLLDEEMKKRNLSARAASREIGVAHTTIIRILEGQVPDVDTFEKVAKWMGVKPSTLLDGDVEPNKAMLVIQALLEQEPKLQKIFEDAADDVLGGRLQVNELRDLLKYAAISLDLRRKDPK